MKDRKIQMFYPLEVVEVKPYVYHERQFIHTKESGGFWCEMRDTTINERLTNSAKVEEVIVQFLVGFNPEIVARWQDLIIVDEFGNTYKMTAKPDEYRYDRNDDLKILAQRFTDRTEYREDRYYERD